jgi:hypothetical protein
LPSALPLAQITVYCCLAELPHYLRSATLKAFMTATLALSKTMKWILVACGVSALIAFLFWGGWISLKTKAWTREEIEVLVSESVKPGWTKAEVRDWLEQQSFPREISERSADDKLIASHLAEEYQVAQENFGGLIWVKAHGVSPGFLQGQIINVYFLFDKNDKLLKFAAQSYFVGL